MTLRLIVAGAICIALGAGSILLERLASQAVKSARQFLGERWYVLELGDRQVGYLHTAASHDREGQWQFRSELRFALQPDEAVTVSDELTFGAVAPHPLERAAHRISQAGGEQNVVIGRDGAAYSAIVSSSEGEPGERVVTLGWSYELGDYLAFETLSLIHI